jgi:hypothetical protein
VGEDDSTRPKGALRAVGELGPAWITSITGLIAVLTAAGFFVGHATASSNAAAQPTVTVIKTVQVGAAANPVSSASAPTSTASTPTSSSSATSASGVANGTQLGSYSIDLSAYYSVPLGATKPTQAQFIDSASGGDLFYNGGDYVPGQSSEQMVSLPDGTTPTYKSCSTGTTFVGLVADTAGASFCVIETSGKLAGIYVTSDQSGYAVLQVTVWQYTSS